MKLNLTPAEREHFLSLAAQARKDAGDDFVKVSAINVMVACIERGEMDEIDHALLDLASIMTTGKELPPFKPRRRSSRKSPERKYKRGTGSY